MGFLEQPFSTPIIYNRDKKEEKFVGKMRLPPQYNYLRSDYILFTGHKAILVTNQRNDFSFCVLFLL